MAFVLLHRLIVDKIDHNGDGEINVEELKDWIKYTQKRYIAEDVNRQWKQHNSEDRDTVVWDDYKKMVYGFLDNMSQNEIEQVLCNITKCWPS